MKVKKLIISKKKTKNTVIKQRKWTIKRRNKRTEEGKQRIKN
jgi:hypothetical protein